MLRSVAVVVLIGLGIPAIPATAQPQSDPALRQPEAEFHMARMVYADGGARGRGRFGFRRGWWAIDYPSAEYHFTRGVRRLSNINVADDSQHVQLTDEDLFDYPWLFAQQVGQGQWSPTDKEAERLREYLLRGGFLVIDDFHGTYQWQIVVAALQKVLPGYSIVDLTPDHGIFHALYDLDQVTQIPGERHLLFCGSTQARLEGPQKWAGVYDKEGRLMVAINFNMDMGDAWEHADDPCYPEPMTALAYRFGLNYVIYAMTH